MFASLKKTRLRTRIDHWTKKWICTNLLMVNMSSKCEDGKFHICVPKNTGCKQIGKCGIYDV